MQLWFVIVLTIVVAAVVVGVPVLGRIGDAAMRGLARIGRSWTRGLLLVAIISIIASTTPAIIWGLPLPNVHDEFAYLLAGDTFAHGRLTNPAHELAEFFETFHVIQSPTYMAKFPVGQGMALAVGFILGHPIIGVWLSVAAACAAVAWMLAAVMPRRWALVGGALAAIHPMTVWWGTSYWGGGVAMLGGALLGGAALRAGKAPRSAWGFTLGFGLAILANSRPLEGLIVATIVLTWLAWSAIQRHQLTAHLMRTIAPAALVLAPTFAFMGLYNWRVTGNALTLPYALHQKQYMVAPLFYYQAPANPPPVYHHDGLKDFYERIELSEYRKQVGADHAPSLAAIRETWALNGENFVNLATLYIPLLAAGTLLVSRSGIGSSVRLAAAACLLLTGVHVLITPWFRPQYMAPAMAFFILLLTTGLRALNSWRWHGHPVGPDAALAVLIVEIIGMILWMPRLAELSRPRDALEREAILSRLRSEPGKQLVLVRYGPRHDPLVERVVNAADIDGSRIVFARSRDDAGDRRLLNYFSDRQAWVLLDDGPKIDLHRLP